MFVADGRGLDASLGVAELRLAGLVHGSLLCGASRLAYQSGIDYLRQSGHAGDTRRTSRLTRVQFVQPVYRDGAMTVGMRWEATGLAGGLVPVLDANIRLSEEGGRGTWLAMTASYRPPFGALSAELDRLLLHKVATATIRIFLNCVASALQETPGAPARRAVPWQWEPGAEPVTG
jgi:hypothetical protein